MRVPLAGAVHWLDPWAVNDPGALVQRYADLFVARGGRVLTGDATSLQSQGVGWSVLTTEGRVDAPQAVLALGPWADGLIRTLGYCFPLFIKRVMLRSTCQACLFHVVRASNSIWPSCM